MKAPFGVGDIVVCVEGAEFEDAKLITGKRYTVSECKIWGIAFKNGDLWFHGNPWVRLFEFKVDPNEDYGGGFMASRFRLYEPPKPEQSTKEMVKPVSVLVPSLE